MVQARLTTLIENSPLARLGHRLDQLKLNAEAVGVLGRAGMLKPAVARTALTTAAKWGPNLAAGYAGSARREPKKIGIVDDQGSITFAEIDIQIDRLTNALAQRGVGAGTPVGLLARNSRWFIIASCALAKRGATVLYMNTGFAGPQLADVMAREGGTLLIHDAEFTDAVTQHAPDLQRIVADRADPSDAVDDAPTLVANSAADEPPKPEAYSRQVILTSGTTGVPKGAARSGDTGSDLVAATGIFERVPMHYGDVHAIPAPMFHSLGLAAILMASQMSHTAVLSRRYEAERVLRLIEQHRVRTMTVVPVMLQRIIDLPAEVTDGIDTSSLEIVFCSGSALPGSLALEWMDRFGDNLYNMYGSTEVAAATIATPEDLRAAPGTAGRPLKGVEVRLYDDADKPVDAIGDDGRIFVGSALRFEGYTGGQTKASIDGLLSSGDVGHFDEAGRLFVGGRDDDMIVSGGENLFPREVEDLLADHESINEVAVIGVDDDEFGKRLAAFVVKEKGARLSEKQVKDHVKANLANFKVPRDVVFLDRLPRNATGKVLKRELSERYD